jgi:hypothetical protein
MCAAEGDWPLVCEQQLSGHEFGGAIGERLSAAAPHWPNALALGRQISVDGLNRRSCGGVRGCWAM